MFYFVTRIKINRVQKQLSPRANVRRTVILLILYIEGFRECARFSSFFCLILDTCHYEFKYLCSVVSNFMQHLKFYENDTKLKCIVQMNKIQMYTWTNA